MYKFNLTQKSHSVHIKDYNRIKISFLHIELYIFGENPQEKVSGNRQAKEVVFD